MNNTIKNPTNARHFEHNQYQKSNIARKGNIAKRCNDEILHHSGMSSLQKGGAGIGGMGHSTATISGGETIATSAAASPLVPHAYGSGIPKAHLGQHVEPVVGQRSQTNADCEDHATKVGHGRDMLAQAVKN